MLKTPPARLTTERHTGPFAAGDALSMGAQVKPLVSAPVKEVRLDTTHKIIEIAPGVMFSAWTFGDQVDPEGMAKSDTIGQQLLAKYKVPMPNQNVSEAEIREYVAYFKWADLNLRPRGEGQPQPADPAASKPPGKTLSGQGGQERDHQNTDIPSPGPAKK